LHEHIRLRVEQELRNLLWRLRRRYIAVGNDGVMLARALARVARPFALALKALLQLAGKLVPAEDRTTAVFEAAAAAFGLAAEPLARLAELRQNPRLTREVGGLFQDVLAAIARAADVVDQIKESPR
jgi:hypothetical protein